MLDGRQFTSRKNCFNYWRIVRNRESTSVSNGKIRRRGGLISRSEDKLKEIVDEIEANGGTAADAITDVSIPDQIKSAFESLYSVLGDFHALINNGA